MHRLWIDSVAGRAPLLAPSAELTVPIGESLPAVPIIPPHRSHDKPRTTPAAIYAAESRRLDARRIHDDRRQRLERVFRRLLDESRMAQAFAPTRSIDAAQAQRRLCEPGATGWDRGGARRHVTVNRPTRGASDRALTRCLQSRCA